VPKTRRFGGKPVDLAAKFWPITGLIYVCRRELRSKKRLPFHPFSKKGSLMFVRNWPETKETLKKKRRRRF